MTPRSRALRDPGRGPHLAPSPRRSADLLPLRRPLRAGVIRGEIIHCDLSRARGRARSLRAWLDDDSLAWLVDFGIDAKLRVMRNDERECKDGLVLEYGHTIGHALELAAPGVLSHGEAVGVGMLCAADVARLSDVDHEAHHALLARIGVNKARARSISTAEVLRLLRFDNKRGYAPVPAGHLPMILLEGLGRPLRSGPRPLVPAPFDRVERVVGSLGERA